MTNRPRTRHECSREGCTSTYSEPMRRKGLTHCSELCCVLDQALDSLISKLQAEDHPTVEEHLTSAYTSLVEAADLISESQASMIQSRLAKSKT